MKKEILVESRVDVRRCGLVNKIWLIWGWFSGIEVDFMRFVLVIRDL